MQGNQKAWQMGTAANYQALEAKPQTRMHNLHTELNTACSQLKLFSLGRTYVT